MGKKKNKKPKSDNVRDSDLPLIPTSNNNIILPKGPPVKPLFAVVTMTKNERQNIVHQIESLKEFLDAGGEYVVYDTGSTDGTIEYLRERGFRVIEAGEIHHKTISPEECARMNEFIGCRGFIAAGEKYFDFAEAKNAAASYPTSSDFIIHLDACDRIERMSIVSINISVLQKVDMFYMEHFLGDNKEWTNRHRVVRSFNRKRIHWQGRCHEILHPMKNVVLNNGTKSGAMNEVNELDPTTMKYTKNLYADANVLSVRYVRDTNKPRSYLIPLILETMDHNEHRWYHYLGREFYYHKLWKTAIAVFRRGITVPGWFVEKSQSLCFEGECWLKMQWSIGEKEAEAKAMECFFEALQHDASRREPWIRMSHVYRTHNNYSACRGMAYAALSCTRNTQLYENPRNYGAEPHEQLFWAHFWLGEIPQAYKHYITALQYEPENQNMLRYKTLMEESLAKFRANMAK